MNCTAEVALWWRLFLLNKIEKKKLREKFYKIGWKKLKKKKNFLAYKIDIASTSACW